MTKGIDTQQERLFFCNYFKHEPEFYCIAMVRFGQEELGRNAAVTVDIAEALLHKKIALLGNVHSGASDELFLIELALTQEGNTSGLQLVFEEIINALSEKYKMVLHTGISTVGTGLSNISKCYEQAKWMVQSLYLYENESKVQVYDESANSMQENLITTDFLSRLYTVLICGKYTDAEKELDRIEGRYSRMPYLYEEHKEQIFWSLHNTFYTVMLHLNCAGWKQHIPIFTPSVHCREMIGSFKNCARWICEYIDHSKKSKNEDLKEEIGRYLQEHYMDPGLSAFTVSSQVGIAEKYLFQFWKEQTGETFAASLLRIRIQKSTEYLEQTDYSNEEIAVLTGFASANTFYRNFQKLMGVTPRTYKENLQK